MSEIERERGQVQLMKLEPMVFSDEPASGELQYKELSKQETPIVGEEVAAEYVGEMEEEVEEKTSGYLYLLYRNGKGEDKTLSQLGLLRKIKDAVKNNQEITKEKGDGSIQERFINQMKAEKGTSFLNSYDFTKVKFALGKATVRPRHEFNEVSGPTMNNIGAASRTGERNARVSFAGGYERGEVHFYYDREQFD